MKWSAFKKLIQSLKTTILKQLTALTYKFYSARFQQVWFVLQDIFFGVVDQFRNMVYSYGTSCAAYHESHADGQVARAWANVQRSLPLHQSVPQKLQSVSVLNKQNHNQLYVNFYTKYFTLLLFTYGPNRTTWNKPQSRLSNFAFCCAQTFFIVPFETQNRFSNLSHNKEEENSKQLTVPAMVHRPDIY